MASIKLSKNCYNTTSVTIYDMPDIKIVDWFEFMDIWGSKGYDRWNDGGLYFELPGIMYDIIPDLPFIRRYQILVVKSK